MYSQIICPSCRHQFDYPNEPNPRTHALPAVNQLAEGAQQEELTFLQGEAHRLDDMIRRLTHERIGLLRRVNAVQASTRHLSFEILSVIFQSARPPIDFGTRRFGTRHSPNSSERQNRHPEDDFQLVLGAVSSHWQQVVWSTPQLWTTLSMQVLEVVSQSNEALLNLYFENARTLPMSVELDLRAQLLLLSKAPDSKSRTKTISALDPIKTSVFTKNAERIRNLILTGCPREWAPSVGKNLSGCETITLLWPSRGTASWDRDRDKISLAGLPCLRHVRLRELSSSPILPYSTITILELSYVSTRVSLELLTQCPKLVQFKSKFAYGTPLNRPVSNKTIVLEHLELLQWDFVLGPWCTTFLRRVRFNNLRVLKWSGRHVSPLSDGFEHMRLHLCEFFSSLPTTLQTFELKDCNYSFDELKDIFSSVRHVPRVRFSQCATYMDEIVIKMIGHSIAGLDWDYSQKCIIPGAVTSWGPKLLANLETLVLDDSPGFCSEHIASMLETLERARTSGGIFRLELAKRMTWEPAVRQRIKQLLERNFKFEVIEESKPVDFMTLSTDFAY